MRSIQTFLLVLLFSIGAVAQAAHHAHSGGPPRSSQQHHSAGSNAVASETIAAANRETASQQRELTTLERGGTHVKQSAPAHPSVAKVQKEHSASNAPINFAYHAPKQANTRAASGRAYSAR